MKVSELTIQLPEAESFPLLKLWEWRFPPSVVPICFSLFGDWFMKDAEGKVRMFEVTSGEVKEIVEHEKEFWALVEVEEYQEEWLLSPLVARLVDTGVRLTKSQCYAFRTPVFLGGQQDPSNIVPWDFKLYQQGLSKLLRQVVNLPPGTQVITKPTNNS